MDLADSERALIATLIREEIYRLEEIRAFWPDDEEHETALSNIHALQALRDKLGVAL